MALLRGAGLSLKRWAGRSAERLEQDFGDPAVTRIREAAEAADWAGVRDGLAAHPEGEDRTWLLWTVGETAGVQEWIGDAVAAEPNPALPLVVAGARQVSWAWEARTRAQAKDVSRERFQLFHERLRQAEELLFRAAELEPAWVEPWHFLQVSGRGLEVGPVLARRRFEAVVRRAPHHLRAHQQHLQQVCLKWGGSHEEMHAFARASMLGAPEGSPLGQLVAVAHIEHWIALGEGPGRQYMRRDETAASLREAAERSVLHPDAERGRGWAQVCNSFALALSLAGESRMSRRCFEAAPDTVTEFPWHYVNPADPVLAYRRHRASVGA
ncbi:hypothetical protein BX286_6539 [Streptomyces sp. 3211.6]|uniref:hypothetical protein n=1 Tax=Streptomyces sp. 3211.6 TaxID=1938845 RepID=UPI000F1175E6|nr:hypothetical protein [Streptomyces sp. 3211.6]RKT08441.1 hypothetical protein BX286_6539 [Streptomyces sp. 3211.6]